MKVKTMPVSKKIIKYLESNKYKYRIIEHKKTFTAWDTAQTEKVKPQEVGKALVMKMDGSYALALVSSNRNLDKQKLLKLVNLQRKREGMKTCKKIDFAKEDWMKKNLPGRVGATPPFSGLVGLPIFIDNLILKNKKIYFGTGEYTFSFLINSSEYMKKEKPVKGSFSKSKK